jgi:hypothetical protein
MLEEIHATPEDRRATQMILALGAVGFGLYLLADAILTQWIGGAVLGTLFGVAGAGMLRWVRTQSRLRLVVRQ